MANVTLAARQLIKPRAFAAIDLACVQLDLNNVSQYTPGDLKLATFQFKPERFEIYLAASNCASILILWSFGIGE